MARATKYTPPTVKAIIDAIKVGGSDVDACHYGGITQETFYQWMKAKPEFSDQVTRARVEGKLARIGRISKAGQNGDWRADAWYLERRWPAEYAQQLVIKVTPEHAEILKRLGVSAAEAWEAYIQELANADANA